jgi:hypothetical protein
MLKRLTSIGEQVTPAGVFTPEIGMGRRPLTMVAVKD